MRESAANKLYVIGESAVEPLIAALEDGRYEPYACGVLARIGTERAFDALQTRLEATKYRTTYINALGANIFYKNHVTGIPTLLRMLQQDDAHTQEAAAGVLARFGEAAVAPLVSVLADCTQSPAARQWAAQALKKSGRTPPNTTAAVQMALHTKDWNAALLTQPSALEPLLAELAASGSQEFSERVIQCLAKIGDARAAAPIGRILRAAPGRDLREAAARALGSLGGSHSREALKNAFDDRDQRVRSAAVAALGQIRSFEVIDLEKPLKDGDTEVRRQAVVVLGKLGRTEAVIERLGRVLRDPDHRVSMQAAQTLDSIGWTPNGGDAEADYRLVSVRHWIEQKSYDQCVPHGSAAVLPLIDALAAVGRGRSTKQERKKIVTALGKIGDARAIATLTRAAKEDDSAGVRRRAKRSIDWINVGAH